MPIDELTNERLLSQDKKFTLMFEQNNKDHTELKETISNGFDNMSKEFKCFRDECDKKYASKLTEIIVYSMAGLILVSVFGYMITQAINK